MRTTYTCIESGDMYAQRTNRAHEAIDPRSIYNYYTSIYIPRAVPAAQYMHVKKRAAHLWTPSGRLVVY